jgi:hypothetical protein
MCIYCNTNNYRKIYEQHYGSIPKDSSGKTYDIHHIDGNRKNNQPNNLVALSTSEHFDLHYSQGDWAACHRLGGKMKLSAEQLSELARLTQEKRVQDGTHPWLDREEARNRATQRVKNGTHPWLGGETQRITQNKLVTQGKHPFQKREDGTSHMSERVENGTHPMQNPKNIEALKERLAKEVANGTHPFVGSELNKKRVAEGTHHFLGGEIVRKTQQRLVSEGKHHFLGGEIQRQGNLKRLAEGNHPSQVVCTCPICQRTIHGRGNLTQHLRKCSKNSEIK